MCPNDVVTVTLDFSKGSLSFMCNNAELGGAFDRADLPMLLNFFPTKTTFSNERNSKSVTKVFSLEKLKQKKTTEQCPTLSPKGPLARCPRRRNPWSAMPDDRDRHVNQETVFDLLGRPMVTSALEGYHQCLLAYGQSGSGKTYSLIGYSPSDRGAEQSQTWTSKVELSFYGP